MVLVAKKSNDLQQMLGELEAKSEEIVLTNLTSIMKMLILN